MGRLRFLLLTLSFLFVNGCMDALFYHSYKEGIVRGNISAPYARTIEATFAALKELGYRVQKEEKGATSAKIGAVRGDGTNVDLTINTAPGNASDIEIATVVVFGGRAIAEEIRAAIYRRLEKSP